MRKSIIKILSSLFPGLFSNIAYKKLNNPQVLKLREHELEVLKEAVQSDIECAGFTIRTYQWGTGSKPILLIHGWEGQAGNFSEFIPSLVSSDFTVYAFDGPAHGFSSKGSASIFTFIEVVMKMLTDTQPRFLISNSFGGVATTYALKELGNVAIEKYALLTTPDTFSERIQSISDSIGISEKVVKRLKEKIESQYNLKVDTLNVSNFVKSIPVEKALIIHDKDDKVIPLVQSQRVADNWEVGELKVIEGTGHFRILRNEEVCQLLLDFFRG